MGTINQQSVREEIDRIKAEFNQLSADKKLNCETKMLFKSMFMLVNLLISIFLEKTTKKEGTFRYCQTEGCEYKMAVENTGQETDAETPEPIAA